MRSTTALGWGAVALLLAAGCVTPRIPGPEHPPAPDRYQRAASPDPAARVSAADELVYDPTPAATQMLLTLNARDIDPTVRAHAAGAIARRLDTSLADPMELSSQRDPDPSVRAASASAHHTLHAWSKRPGVAGGLAVLPGAGHLYLGEDIGWAYTLSTVALIGGGLSLLSGQNASLSGGSSSAKVPVGVALATYGQNLWFYSIFDAYRDARVARGDVGYDIPISHESLDELVTAPFRPSVLKSPWVWAGVPAMLVAGIGISYLVERGMSTDPAPPTIFDVKKVNVLGRNFSPGAGFAAGSGFYAALFATVGVGEEALFRGVIQTELEERWGLGGVAITSALFGAAHVGNFSDGRTAAIAIPTLSVLGATLGMAYRMTGHKLATSTAMHFWYDTLLSLTAFAVDPQNQVFSVQPFVRPW